MRLTNEYLGSVFMENTEHVIAGCVDTWKVVFTVGKYGIDDNGSIKIVWRNPSDWGVPQFDAPTELNYTVASVNKDVTILTELEYFVRPFINGLVIRVKDGYLVEGDVITIILGDTSGGGPGMKAQTFCEEIHEFRVYADPYGTRKYERVPHDIAFPVYSGKACELHAVARSTFDKKRNNEILLRAIDTYGNIAEGFEDDIAFELIDAKGNVLQNKMLSMAPKDKGLLRHKLDISLESGVYYVQVKAQKNGFQNLSNPFEIRHDAKNLYFGDMHGQTSSTIGTGSLDRYFQFARDSAYVDFTGWQGNDFQVDNFIWNDVREATKKYHDPQEFTVFLGYEWSGMTGSGGDHNVYFLNDSEEFYPSSNWQVDPNNVNAELNAYNIPELLEKVKGRDDVMIIPHIGGRYGTLEFDDLHFTPVIEVHSHHGTFEWFIMDAMKARKKVGFISASDDHTCRPGMSYPLSKDGKGKISSFEVGSGYTALYANSLDKKDIWQALKARYCYATTFNRMIVDVDIDGYHMGEAVTGHDAKQMQVTVHGNSPIDTIELYNWEEKIEHVNMRPKDSKKIRVAWAGLRARTRRKAAAWNGSIELLDGKILHASEYAFDRKDQGIKSQTDTRIEWTSNTSGDYDGVILDVSFNENTLLVFKSAQKDFTIKISEITEDLTIIPAGGENLKIEVSLANVPCSDFSEFIQACNISHTFTQLKKNDDGSNAYWVRILQEDGHTAWSSPIFIE